MEPSEYEGVWWDPRNPDEEWFGILRFDDAERASLTVHIPADKPDPLPVLRAYDLILGRASNGQHITLIDCFDSNTRGSLFGVPRRLSIFVNSVILGFHCEDADPVLDSVSVSFDHLNEWWGRSGISADPSAEHPDLGVRYTASDPVVLHDDGVFHVELQSGVSASMAAHEASLREDHWFAIGASSPRRFSEFRRLTQACGDFLSIVCLTLCESRELTVVPSAPAGARRRSGTFHAVPIYRSRKQDSGGTDMLLRFSDIEGRAAAIFGAWLSKQEELQDARTLFFTGLYGRGFLEHKLLALSQGAEALHRRFFPSWYMNKTLFETDVLMPLVAAIPAGVNDSFRTSITSRLKFSNEVSLRHRLRTLFVEHLDTLTVLVEKPLSYVSPIVDTRNEFTHFPAPAAESSGKPGTPKRDRVLQYNWILRLLLEACFLNAVGLANEEICRFVSRSDTYRQMASRFRDQGTSAG